MREQTKLTRDLAKATIDSAIARVAIDSASLKSIPVAGLALPIQVFVRNSGKSIASNPSVITSTNVFRQGKYLTDAWPWEQQKLGECLSQQPEEGRPPIYPDSPITPGELSVEKDKIDRDVVSGEKVVEFSICYAYVTFLEVRHSAACFFYQTGRWNGLRMAGCRYGGFNQ